MQIVVLFVVVGQSLGGTFSLSHQRVSDFPQRGVDLWGGPGNLWGSPGNFWGSLGNFRGTSGLLSKSIAREVPGSRLVTSGKSSKFPDAH